MATPHPQAHAHMTPCVLPGPHAPPSLALGPWAGSLLITEQSPPPRGRPLGTPEPALENFLGEPPLLSFHPRRAAGPAFSSCLVVSL